MGKMKFVGLVSATTLVIMSIQGCAVNKVLVPTGGSRSDGTVKLSFEYGGFEKPMVVEQQGLDDAKKRCASWGYTGAEKFGGATNTCIQSSGGSCDRYLFTYEYQCTGTPAASK